MSSNKRLVQKHAADRASEGSISSASSKTIPVMEEQLHLDKEIVETGGVRISKKVYTDDVSMNVPVTEEHYDIERVEINQYVDTPPPPVRHQGDTTIIPVLKEVLVKRLVLVEELHITKRNIKKQAKAEASLRTEKVKVERFNGQEPDKGRKDSVES